MGTIHNANTGKSNPGGQQRHDGQKNYQHSNQRNPDNIRNNTRDHEYRDHDEDEMLTNDANFDIYTSKIKGDANFDDTMQNVDKDKRK